MKERIIKIMEEKSYIPRTLSELAEILNVSELDLEKELQILVDEYVVRVTKKKKYDLLKKFNLHIGTIDIKEKGFGFIKSDDFAEEFYVSKDFIGDSMDRDKVLFSITSDNDAEGYKKEAAVVEVIERGLKLVLGKIINKKGKKTFIANDKKLDLIFKVNDFGIAVIDDVVVFEIKEYVNGKLVRGRIKEILGNINDVGIDIKSIAYKYEFSNEFPEAVIDELKTFSDDISSEAKKRRRVTGKVITIDSESAKDLDNAVGIRKLDNGNYELGVYIADVSYYVRKGHPLDNEAFNRGTSVYLTNYVIPMLPHKLSNDLCSLNPGVDRLIMGCLMEINPDGKVVNSEIFEGVIKTTYRMTYTAVNSILDNDKKVIEEFAEIAPDVKLMAHLAEILRKMRVRRGALDFDIPESKIIVNEVGKPIDIVPEVRGLGEKLIEEFMLIANETVAQTIENLHLPFIYRVHDEPNTFKLSKFSNVVRSLGYKLSIRKERVTPQALQDVLSDIREEDDGLRTLLLRMMAKAKYSEKNIGHYGLASVSYTHFTSPIRRYPDLIVHRLLRKYLIKNEVSVEDQEEVLDRITYIAAHSSKKERDAIECEYEVNDMKKAEYMEDYIGQEFMAKITSVTNFGLFASLENTVEGLIHISSLDGYYVYEELKMSLVSRNNAYRLGDIIKIRVKNASKETRQIDFEIVEDSRSEGRKKDNRKKQKSKS